MHIVYKITNLINKKIYIGVHAVADIEVDDGYMGSGKAIQSAIKKYGIETFKKEILVVFEDVEAAYLAESMVVDESFVNRSDTYNMKCGGFGFGSGKNHPHYGKTHTDETKAKISAALSGKSLSEETKAKMSVAKSGERNPFYGKSLSEETKAKMSVAKSGENNPRYGKSLSEETKAKLSAAQKEYYRLKNQQNR